MSLSWHTAIECKLDSAQDSLIMVRKVLDNTPGPARDIVLLNAGAAIYVAGLAVSLEAGVVRATEVLESGAARAKLDALVELSAQLVSETSA